MSQPHTSRTETTRDNWMTPRDFVEQVCTGLGIEQFDFDAAADPASTVASWFTHDLESCIAEGHFREFSGYIWCNPPFVLKNVLIPLLLDACRNNSAAKLIMLIPIATETKLWKEHIWQEDLIFLGSRLKFLDPDTGKPAGSPAFTCALLCMNLTLEELRGVDKAVDAARTIFSTRRLAELFAQIQGGTQCKD